MPVLPFIEDNEKNILKIVNKADYYGVKYIVPFLGMSLRDRQRDYYYKKLDENFPDIKEKYIKKFGNRYKCYDPNITKLGFTLKNECSKYGISLKMPSYAEKISGVQLNFLKNS